MYVCVCVCVCVCVVCMCVYSFIQGPSDPYGSLWTSSKISVSFFLNSRLTPTHVQLCSKKNGPTRGGYKPKFLREVHKSKLNAFESNATQC